MRMQSDRCAREIVRFLMLFLAARSRRLMREAFGGLNAFSSFQRVQSSSGYRLVEYPSMTPIPTRSPYPRLALSLLSRPYLLWIIANCLGALGALLLT